MRPVVRAHAALRACPVCGAASGVVLIRQQWVLFADHPLLVASARDVSEGRHVLELSACSRCGMVYSSPVAGTECFARYYSNWSRYADGSDGLSGPPDEATLERYRGTVALVAPHLESRHVRILDVGCLEGGLLTQLQEAGFSHVHGVDPAPRSAECAALAGLDVRTATLSAIPHPDGWFDFVSCIHVLEHVVDLNALDLFRVLAPGGRLYIEVPDCAAYDPYSPDLFFDLSLEHINHFDRSSLVAFLERRGFRALEVGVRTYPPVAGRAGMQGSVYGIFVKSSTGEISDSHGDSEHEALRRYLELSQARAMELDSRLSRFLSPEEPFSLWGTGHAAFRLLGLPALLGARMVAATDANPLYWGKRLGGGEVVAPQDFLSGTGKVVVTSAVHALPIAERLRASGWRGEVFLP